MRTHLSFVSWNLHGIPFVEDPQARFVRVAERVRGLEPAPQLLLFQEVWSQSLADLLEGELPDYELVPDDDSDWLGRRPSGLMALVLRDGPWKVDEVLFEQFEAYAPWWRVWEGDGLSSKGVQQLRLSDGESGLVLLNTHLQARYGKPEYAPIVAAQLAQLTRLAGTLGDRRPIIAAGDLNTPAGAPDYAALRAHWVDLTAGFRARCGCGTAVRDDAQRGKWIDYVLAYALPHFRVEADLNLLANDGRDDPYSDHNGLLARLRIESAATAAWLLGAALLGGGRRPLGRRDLLIASGALLAGFGRLPFL